MTHDTKEQQLELIKNRDYTLLIDQSPSMNRLVDNGSPYSRWDAVREATYKLARVIERHDPDGITIYTFADHLKPGDYRKDNVGSDEVVEIFERQKPIDFGDTNTGEVLEHALASYFDRSSSNGYSKNGETIIIVTDGEASDYDKLLKVILNAGRQVEVKGKLGISFLQIGADEEATRFLKYLDDDIQDLNKDYVDIVDMKTFEEIRKEGIEITNLLIHALFD